MQIKKWMLTQLLGLLLVLLASGLVSGCITSGAAFGIGISGGGGWNQEDLPPLAPLPEKGPPQVVYRIDKDRYFTLEGYSDCRNGWAYYHNDKTGVRINTEVYELANFKGRLIWATTQDRFMALPSFSNHACPERGCIKFIHYRDIDSQQFRHYDVNGVIDGGKDYTLVVTDNGFYFHEEWGNDDSAYYVDYNTIGNNGVNYHKETKFPKRFRTPSGQERIQCDVNLVPKANRPANYVGSS